MNTDDKLNRAIIDLRYMLDRAPELHSAGQTYTIQQFRRVVSDLKSAVYLAFRESNTFTRTGRLDKLAAVLVLANTALEALDTPR